MMIRALYPFTGHVVGGSHLSALTLIRHLPKDIEPVIAVAQEGPLTAYLAQHGMNWLRLPPIKAAQSSEFARAALNAPALSAFLQHHRIDIVHSNEYDMNSLWPLAKARLKTRHIWHQRSLNNSRRLALYAPLVDHYFTISAFCRDNLTAAVRRRAEILPNPVEIDADQPAQPLPGGGFKIGFVGHLDRQKRILNFIAIAGRILASGTDASFYIFGDTNGPLAQQAMDDARRTGIAGRCHFMGQKFPIAPWIKSLDLLMAPAAGEGLGRAIIEAQMLDVPVLASADGGHRELIEDGKTGWLAPLDDDEAFAQRVAAFIAAPDAMRQVCAAARGNAVNRYGVARHIARAAEVYRGLSSNSA